MTWFRVVLRFARPPTRAALDDLVEWLDYPELKQLDPVGHQFALTIEARDAKEARSVPADVLAWLRAVGIDATAEKPTETTDPRVPSPLTAEVLNSAGEFLDDQLRADLEALSTGLTVSDTWVVSQHLPACFSRHYTPELIERWREAILTTVGVLLSYPETYLASTAEELAGHAIIREAQNVIAEYAEDGRVAAEELAVASDKIEEIHDIAFEDHDVLMLFDRKLDGVEEGPVAADLMGLINLHPAEWFLDFDPERARARGT